MAGASSTDGRAIFGAKADAVIQWWNWKAAMLSVAFRAPIFIATTYAYGWRSVSLAVLVEAAYRAGTSGMFAGFVQVIRHRRPAWLAALLIVVAVPGVEVGLDYLLHLGFGTPNLTKGILLSLAVSVISSLFTWYTMWHGTLLVGEERTNFASDLGKMPGLVLGFVLSHSCGRGNAPTAYSAG